MKIVTLSTYPISHPFHGGQRRLDAIARVLRDAGHEVCALPLFFGGHYPEHDADEARTALPGELFAQMSQAGWREDLHMHRVLGPGVSGFDSACARLREIDPDVLHFEQPWLFPLLEALLATLPDPGRVAIVYGSQNVESVLVPQRFRDETRALEEAAARRADMIVAVSAADAQVLSHWRAPGRDVPVIVAPNGSWAPTMDVSVPRPLDEDYLLLVGSGHAPNAEGYWDVIGRIPGCIPPDARLVVVGGLGDLLRSDPRFRHFRLLNDHLVHLMGKVSEEVLQALLTHAAGVCLPIKSGGGTNLKTAEALLTLKPVIAMRPAFRGYEEAIGLGGVRVAETEDAFRAAVRDLFAGTLTGSRQAADVARYTWNVTLGDLPAAYSQLARGGA